MDRPTIGAALGIDGPGRRQEVSPEIPEDQFDADLLPEYADLIGNALDAEVSVEGSSFVFSTPTGEILYCSPDEGDVAITILVMPISPEDIQRAGVFLLQANVNRETTRGGWLSYDTETESLLYQYVATTSAEFTTIAFFNLIERALAISQNIKALLLSGEWADFFAESSK